MALPERSPDDRPERPAVPVAGGVVAVLLAVFVFQNTATTKVTWLVFETRHPLWFVLVVNGLFSVLMAKLLGMAWRRRRRDD